MKKILICILAVSMLAACGIKPSRVTAPAGEKDVYPRQYPAPVTDDNTEEPLED